MIKNRNLITICLILCLGLVGLLAAPKASAFPRLLNGHHKKVCTNAADNAANCLAQFVADSSGSPAASPGPTGYGPAQFHSAYQLPTTSVKAGTIGIVDAYDDPNIASDLASYDTNFGLPVFPTCTKTVTSACFEKVNQNGGTSYPQRSTGWALETSLDVETAHQICQNCKIILTEATSASYSNLMKAVNETRLLGATVISNSYGSGEFSTENSFDQSFKYPGVAFVFSSGDSGYGSTYPAASPYVTAVGGTTLNLNSAGNWSSESVWGGSSSGCSLFEARPSFQTNSSCANRAIADVSADADPNTGAAVFDSYSYLGRRGWFQIGGTSLAAPIIAGIYGLANNVGSSVFANSLPYANLNYSLNIHDITAGSNGTCGGLNLCQAAVGYDGPTGLGSPIGLGAF